MKNSELQNAVKKLKKVSLKNNCMPICDNVLNENGTLTVTNLEITYTVNTGFPGKFLVNLKELEKITAKLPKEADIDMKSENGKVFIFAGPAKFTFTSANIEDFPNKPKTPEKLGILGEEDINLIVRAVKYTADDFLRPVMNCVFVSDHIVASDAQKMVYYKHKKETEDFLIPAGVVKLMAEEAPFSVCKSKDNKYIELYAMNETIIYRQPDNEYPQYMNVIPQNNGIVYSLNNKEVAGAVKLAMIAANETSQLIRLKFNTTTLNIFASDLDFEREFSQDIPCQKIKSDTDEFEIGFKGTFLLEILADCDESVTVSMSEPSRAAIFDDNKLLMPMMITA